MRHQNSRDVRQIKSKEQEQNRIHASVRNRKLFDFRQITFDKFHQASHICKFVRERWCRMQQDTILLSYYCLLDIYPILILVYLYIGAIMNPVCYFMFLWYFDSLIVLIVSLSVDTLEVIPKNWCYSKSKWYSRVIIVGNLCVCNQSKYTYLCTLIQTHNTHTWKKA